MKNIRIFLSENFPFFGVEKFSVYLNRHVFVMVPSDMCAQRRLKSDCASTLTAWRNFASLAIQNAQWRFWLDRRHEQADMNFHWAHMSGGTFSEGAAHRTPSFQQTPGPVNQCRLEWTFGTSLFSDKRLGRTDESSKDEMSNGQTSESTTQHIYAARTP